MHEHHYRKYSEDYLKCDCGKIKDKSLMVEKHICGVCKNNINHQQLGTYEISVSYIINTFGGEETAKKIFSNLIALDPNRPLSHLKIKDLND